jgi:hypothetical protein
MQYCVLRNLIKSIFYNYAEIRVQMPIRNKCLFVKGFMALIASIVMILSGSTSMAALCLIPKEKL